MATTFYTVYDMDTASYSINVWIFDFHIVIFPGFWPQDL